MSFHKDELGAFGSRLDEFADFFGYIPEAGDKQKGLHYPTRTFRGRDWEQFRALVVEETAEVVGALHVWQVED